MRSDNKYPVVFLFLFLFAIPLAAQNGSINKTVELKGVLVQESNAEPLAFATVVLYNSVDSTIAKNALTELDGSFSMQAEAGSYYLEMKFIGFQGMRKENILVDDSRSSMDFGLIKMQADAVALEEVTVRAERSQMELKLDRRVFNVGKDLANAGNSAADVLDRVPSVNVDPEGNVSLRGSNGVRILVNGKPSGLLSSGDTEALLRMQGDIIESVEVITNPSARYEAEGEAGIINIILKKNKEKGVNGSFGATIGNPDNFGASYNLNFRRSDFNFFSNFGLNYRKTPGGGTATQQFFDNNGNITEYFTSDEDQLRGGINGFIQGGMDWLINDKTTLTGSVLFKRGKDNNNGNVTYTDFDADRNVIASTVREVAEDQIDSDLEMAFNFKKTYDKKDQEWTIDFKYILNDDTELADYDQSSTEAIENLFQKSSNTEDERNLLFQTDYILPFGESSKLEGGLRAALRTVNNDFYVDQLNASGSFDRLPDFNDNLKYIEDIYAAYFILAHEFEAIGIQGGLRAEYSDITASLLRSGVSNDQFYMSFFPSMAVSFKFSEKNQLQLSYSRRLSRPGFRDLLPFSNFNDPRNNGVGNPNLRPEFTDSYETGFLRYFENGSLLTSLYYRRTTGVIEDLTLPADDGTAIEYPVNLSTRKSYGLEMSFSYDLADWWDLSSDFNAFRAIINGEFEGVSYDADTYSWSGGLISKFDISDDFKFQASFDYNAPINTTQGRRLSTYSFDLAASLDILKGKGTLTLSGRDLFNTRQRRNEVDLPNYRSESVFQWRQTRQAVLTFNYRLNE